MTCVKPSRTMELARLPTPPLDVGPCTPGTNSSEHASRWFRSENCGWKRSTKGSPSSKQRTIQPRVCSPLLFPLLLRMSIKSSLSLTLIPARSFPRICVSSFVFVKRKVKAHLFALKSFTKVVTIMRRRSLMFETVASDVCGPSRSARLHSRVIAGVPGTDEITPHSKVTNCSLRLTAPLLAATHRQPPHYRHPETPDRDPLVR